MLKHLICQKVEEKTYGSRKRPGKSGPDYAPENTRIRFFLNTKTTLGHIRASEYRQLALNLDLFFHPGTDKQKGGRALLENAMQHLEAFYLPTKLQLAAEMRTTYYEQYLLDPGSFFFVLDQLDAFERFIRRNKNIASDKGKAYLAFCRFSRKIARKRYEHADTSGQARQVQAQSSVSFREWLLEKMETP